MEEKVYNCFGRTYECSCLDVCWFCIVSFVVYYIHGSEYCFLIQNCKKYLLIMQNKVQNVMYRNYECSLWPWHLLVWWFGGWVVGWFVGWVVWWLGGLLVGWFGGLVIGWCCYLREQCACMVLLLFSCGMLISYSRVKLVIQFIIFAHQIHISGQHL